MLKIIQNKLKHSRKKKTIKSCQRKKKPTALTNAGVPLNLMNTEKFKGSFLIFFISFKSFVLRLKLD